VPGSRALLACFWLLLSGLAGLATDAAAAEADPFAVSSVRVSGRPVAFTAGRFGGSCPGKSLDWLIVSVSGSPPEEQRSISVFPCGPAGAIASAPRRVLAAPANAVAYDAAELDGAEGQEIVFLTADAVVIHNALSDAAPRIVALPERLPLPPRTRDLSRMAFVGPWDGAGSQRALLPSSAGGLLVDLTGDEPARPIALPLLAEYDTFDPTPPVKDELLTAKVVWPGIQWLDDNADGLPDLIATSRYAAWIFHASADGLPSEPSRKLALRPFTPEEELRHETSVLRWFSRDMDGDGRVDLIVDLGAGTLVRSHHLTQIHRNPGSGFTSLERPDAAIEVEDGIASIQLVDLDGDGAVEVLHSRIGFGLVQIARLLVSRRAEVEQRSYSLIRSGDGFVLERRWEDSLPLRLDLASGRAADLLPTALGDWNGDGRRDLLYGVGGKGLAIRLGIPGPGFGPRVAGQRLPEGSTSSDTAIADLDGDGLDDLVVFDPRDSDGTVHLLRNRGTLPGSAPQLTTSEPE
jgi:hypothetical protein